LAYLLRLIPPEVRWEFLDELYGEAADPTTVKVAGVTLDKSVMDEMTAQRERALAKRQSRTASEPAE